MTQIVFLAGNAKRKHRLQTEICFMARANSSCPKRGIQKLR
ncbi:hypothetical protein RBSH_01383 [Rhodopirellula baltica SH28]|uniref:Uncharacterized protein n=1 Tax=Rhodopirellula baltica SH28 TaxID=993517 RepID=K5DKD1_RHOBT|nr:hypothetical protein RBSH_01383 [Rhodopirellula baltica SH28]